MDDRFYLLSEKEQDVASSLGRPLGVTPDAALNSLLDAAVEGAFDHIKLELTRERENAARAEDLKIRFDAANERITELEAERDALHERVGVAEAGAADYQLFWPPPLATRPRPERILGGRMSEERESELARRPDRSAGRPDPVLAPVPVAVAVLAAVLALLLAGCESDDDSTTEARLSTEPKPAEVSRAAVLVAQAGNGWAPLFANNALWACQYMYPPAWVGPDSHGQQPTPPLPAARRFARRLCAGFGLEVGPGPHDRPPSGFQKSFADTTVERVAVKGDKAWAEFSNGELVEFIRVAQAELPIGVTPGWYIYRLGGDAGKKYFEP